MTVRLLCLDVDGTLFGPDKQVTSGVRAAVAQARAAGLPLAIASGRHPFSVADICEDLGIPYTAVCLSGAYTVHEGHEVARCPLHPAGVAAALDIAQQTGSYLSLSGADFNLCAGVPDWMRARQAASGVGSLGHAGRYEFLGTFDELRAAAMVRGPSILKAAVNAPDDASFERLRALLADAPDIETARSDTRWVDVTAPGCSKAHGIAALARVLGIRMDEVAAVGDDENDLASLAAVGLGIAMGNASPQVKAVCRAVVADNAHDGCAEAIRLALAAAAPGHRDTQTD